MQKAVLRALVVVSSMVAAISANAVVFSNVIIVSPPLSTGATFNTNANSISFFTPNAIVGDPVHPVRSGILNIQYDASNFGGPNIYADEVVVNLGTAIAGSGTIFFQEQVFELDSNNNEIPGPIGTVSQTFDVNSPMIWNTTIMLSRQVSNLRVKKSFVMSAVDTQAFDLAAVAIVNQNLQLVPEPATLAILGLGALAVVRKRRK